MSEQQHSPATIAVVAGRPHGPGAPLNPSIVLASNFRDGDEYARTHGTDTWAALEEAVGALERGAALAFASGMAAASALVHALAPRTLVIPTFCYQGLRALLDDLAERAPIEIRRVDVAATAAVLAAAEGADVVWLESPTNPTLDVADLPTILAACRATGTTTVVDNTFATPLAQQPLLLGATAVLHSGTKFIGGHSDLTIGIIVTNEEALLARLVRARTLLGATPGSLEAFLALRGLRTLPLRLERATASAVVLATRLEAHPAIESVRQVGAMVSFVVAGGASGDAASRADRAIAAAGLVVAATSLGGVETTMERRQKYAGDAHVPPGLVRMSVGIEDVDDLWRDLSAALAAAG